MKKSNNLYGLSSLLKEINLEILTKEEETELVKRAKQNDIVAIHELIERNLLLAAYVCKKYYNNTVINKEDMFNDCVIGLLNAIKKYDINQNTRFSSYAYFYMKSIIEHDFRKICKHDGKTFSYEAMLREMEKTNPNNTTLDDIEKIEVLDEFCINFSYFSLQNPESVLLHKSDLEHLKPALEKLSPIEQEVIKAYFDLDNTGEEKTFQEIGEMYHFSKQRTFQIYQKALKKMRRTFHIYHK